MKNVIVCCVCLFLFNSCKKKDQQIVSDPVPPIISTPTVQAQVYDTIKPCSYFPVYPGSYWRYGNNYNNDTITYQTSAQYKLDSYVIYNMAGKYYSDTCYVPFYNGVPIWGYREHTGAVVSYGPEGASPLIYVVSDSMSIGHAWQAKFASHDGVERRIQTKDTSIVINGQIYYPVIVVKEDQVDYNNNYPVIYGTEYLYYALDIGLIKIESKSLQNPMQPHVELMHIVAFHINK